MEITECLAALRLARDPLYDASMSPTALGKVLELYFEYRAHVLDTEVQPALMDANEAEALYLQIRAELQSELPIPMNKQKGEKKKPAFLTGMINMLVEAHRGKHSCDYDPRVLTAFTKFGIPVRTLSRRVDGAFPAAINPVALWETKEYYYTTTFGSRVADGVYETQLDGLELQEMRAKEGVQAKHYLFLDARRTWWMQGKSYLCRICDMVQMGLVDEVIVGRQVERRVPELVREWCEALETRRGTDEPRAPAAGAPQATDG